MVAPRQGLARAGHIGHHGGGLAAEQAQQDILRGLDEQPGHGPACRKGQQRLRAALGTCMRWRALRAGARWGCDADGRHHRHQAEMVANFQASSMGRRSGIMARISLPSGVVPMASRWLPMAPATQDSNVVY